MTQQSCGLGHNNLGHFARAEISDRLLDDYEVAQITRRARSTLQKDRVSGTGIPFVRIGRLVRYRQSDVTAYLAELPSLRSTSEAA
jgi:predicted DNA-binding transcriptional regulator AlpA